MRKARIFVLLLVLALVAAACGSSGDDETTTTAAASGGEETTTTAAPSGGDDETTTTTAPPEEPMEMMTDFGVDLEAGTITVGQTADLTGAFAPLVAPIISLVTSIAFFPLRIMTTTG